MTDRATYIKARFQTGHKNSSVASENVVSNLGIAEPTYFTQPSTLFAAAAATTETASSAGGARSVVVFGLGSGYIEQTEKMWLDGTSPVPSAKLWLRVDNTWVQDVGSLGVNQAHIWFGANNSFTAGAPNNKITIICSGRGECLNGAFSVPNSVEAHVHNLIFNSGKAGGGDVISTFDIRWRPLDVESGAIYSWRTAYVVDVFDGDTSGQAEADNMVIPGPADIQIRSKGSAVGAQQSFIIGYELHKTLQGVRGIF